MGYLDGIQPSTKKLTAEGKEVYLIYIGRTKNLFDRFKSHLGFTNTSHGSITHGFISTLRVSYMANHKDINCLSQADELNQFMDEHIYIQYMVTEDFVAIEERLIKENDLPLNIKGNSHTFVQTNKLRRKAIIKKYNKENTNSVSTTHAYDIQTYSKKQNNKSNSMIDDKILREFARKAEKSGIKNKSNFLRWFRDIQQQSAAMNRLYKAWDERHSDG